MVNWRVMTIEMVALGIILAAFLPACSVSEREGELEMEGTSPQGSIQLPPVDEPEGLPIERCLARRRSVRSFSSEPLTIDQVGRLCWAAQGVTEERYGFRTAPSAGATYPLILYLADSSGAYRYDPTGHQLVRQRDRDVRRELSDAALSQGFIGQAPLVFIVAARYERTTGRYGARGERYVHMEVGHVGQNIHLEAVSLGLGSVPVGAFDDGQVRRVMNLPKGEDPLYIIPVGYPAGRR